jgi:hypothetical protein
VARSIDIVWSAFVVVPPFLSRAVPADDDATVSTVIWPACRSTPATLALLDPAVEQHHVDGGPRR